MEVKKGGTLFICPTPIGNLEDITIRVLKTLRQVSFIAAEDTRETRKLLQRYRIKTPLVSFHKFNERKKLDYILDRIGAGEDVALVSDAGTPGISDPGETLIREAISRGVRVEVLPGPTTFVPALLLSGLKVAPFSFEGFLPAKRGERVRLLKQLALEKRTMIFYEAPHRLLATLQDLLEVFGQRRVAVAREISKKFEEVFRGSLGEALDYFEERPIRGEFTLVVEGYQESPSNVENPEEMVRELMAEGLSKKEAIALVASRTGLPKREIYRRSLDLPGS